MNGTGSVKIKSKYARPECVVRIKPEAVKVLERLAVETGQTKTYLASQLIIQGSEFLELCPEECDECRYRESCDRLRRPGGG